MIVLLFVVCAASLLFFAVFLFQTSRPRRTPRKEPVVRKVSTSEAVEPAARGTWLIHLEQQMAEFLLQNKTTAILLVVLAISSASLVAQEQGGPNSDQQQPRQMAEQASDPINASAAQPRLREETNLGPINQKLIGSGGGRRRSIASAESGQPRSSRARDDLSVRFGSGHHSCRGRIPGAAHRTRPRVERGSSRRTRTTLADTWASPASFVSMHRKKTRRSIKKFPMNKQAELRWKLQKRRIF